MRKRFLSLVPFVASATLVAWPTRAQAPSEHPECIQVEGRAQFSGYAYNHIVHLHNGCSAVATCRVFTNVNPTERTVRVPIDASMDLVTFQGSPARVFEAHAACVLEEATESGRNSRR